MNSLVHRVQLPRFVPNIEEDQRNALQERLEAKRRQQVILAGYACFLLGGALLVCGMKGTGFPIFILSVVFFGIGVASTILGFLRKH